MTTTLQTTEPAEPTLDSTNPVKPKVMAKLLLCTPPTLAGYRASGLIPSIRLNSRRFLYVPLQVKQALAKK